MVVKSSNVRVLARIRPALTHEYQYEQAAEVLSSTKVRLRTVKQTYESSYDQVFSECTSQEAVYSCVQDCVPSLLAGYNNTILTYGQTGTGKTYTMIGDQAMTLQQACTSPSSSSGHGIVPRAVHDLFQELDRARSTAAAGSNSDVKLILSYLEIYNDRLYDLLQPYKCTSSKDPIRIAVGKTSLEVREDLMAGTHVPNLLYVDVQNCRQVLQLVAAGNCNRATAHTDRNQHSSRSHAILQFWLEQRPSAAAIAAADTSQGVTTAAASVVVRSKLNFVDLAGSERWGKAHTESETKTLVSELTSINNSLSALALVVAALTDKSAKHVPYRSSRLTHLLQDSLGGNCNTSLIVTVAPCIDAVEESMASLKFADRTRNISNKAVVNSMHDTDTILAIKEREIQRLRALLATYTSTGGTKPIPGLQSTEKQFSQWQQWVTASDSFNYQEDGLVRAVTNPGSLMGLVTNSSSLAARSYSPQLTVASQGSSSGSTTHTPTSPKANATMSSVAGSSASIDTSASVTAVAAAAAAAAAADKAALEAELAAARAALELERNIRNALEGQIQELSAAAQAQQQQESHQPPAAVTIDSVQEQPLAAELSLSGRMPARVGQPIASRESARNVATARSAVAAWPTLTLISPRHSAVGPLTAAGIKPRTVAGDTISTAGAGAAENQRIASKPQQQLRQQQQIVNPSYVQQQRQACQQQQQQQSVSSKQQHRPQRHKVWIDNWQSPTLNNSKAGKPSTASDNTASRGPFAKGPAGRLASPSTAIQAAAAAATAAPAEKPGAGSPLSCSSGGVSVYAVQPKGKWPAAPAQAADGRVSNTAATHQTKACAGTAAGFQGNGVSAAGFHTAREAHGTGAVLTTAHSCPSSSSAAAVYESGRHPAALHAVLIGNSTQQGMLHLPQLIMEPTSPTPNAKKASAPAKAVQKLFPGLQLRGPTVPVALFSQSSPSALYAGQESRRASGAVKSAKGAAGKAREAQPPPLRQQQQQGWTAVAAASCAGSPASAGWGRSWLLQKMQQQQQQQQQQQAAVCTANSPAEAALQQASAANANAADVLPWTTAVQPTRTASGTVQLRQGQQQGQLEPRGSQHESEEEYSEQYSEQYDQPHDDEAVVDKQHYAESAERADANIALGCTEGESDRLQDSSVSAEGRAEHTAAQNIPAESVVQAEPGPAGPGALQQQQQQRRPRQRSIQGSRSSNTAVRGSAGITVKAVTGSRGNSADSASAAAMRHTGVSNDSVVTGQQHADVASPAVSAITKDSTSSTGADSPAQLLSPAGTGADSPAQLLSPAGTGADSPAQLLSPAGTGADSPAQLLSPAQAAKNASLAGQASALNGSMQALLPGTGAVRGSSATSSSSSSSPAAVAQFRTSSSRAASAAHASTADLPLVAAAAANRSSSAGSGMSGSYVYLVQSQGAYARSAAHDDEHKLGSGGAVVQGERLQPPAECGGSVGIGDSVIQQEDSSLVVSEACEAHENAGELLQQPTQQQGREQGQQQPQQQQHEEQQQQERLQHNSGSDEADKKSLKGEYSADAVQAAGLQQSANTPPDTVTIEASFSAADVLGPAVPSATAEIAAAAAAHNAAAHNDKHDSGPEAVQGQDFSATAGLRGQGGGESTQGDVTGYGDDFQAETPAAGESGVDVKGQGIAGKAASAETAGQLTFQVNSIVEPLAASGSAVEENHGGASTTSVACFSEQQQVGEGQGSADHLQQGQQGQQQEGRQQVDDGDEVLYEDQQEEQHLQDEKSQALMRLVDSLTAELQGDILFAEQY